MEGGKDIYCAIRNEYVVSQPEELVRQSFLHYMFLHGFPKSLIAVETPLKLMPHLSGINPLTIPDRRADIICYGKGIHPHYDLFPLLLVECKAVKLTSRVINQVTGYNQFVKSYFITIVNSKEIKTGWFDIQQNSYVFINNLPSYEDLMKAIIIPNKS